jgi:hypothetical protein
MVIGRLPKCSKLTHRVTASAIFFMAAYLPQCLHVVDNTVFYWSGHLMSEHVERYA